MARPLSPGRSFLRLLDDSTTPLYVLDSGRRIIFASRALSEWAGFPLEKLIGLSCQYDSGSDEPLGQAAAALGPPPEAFTGHVLDGSISRLAAGNRPFERRPARFVKLAGATAADSLLVVIVLINENIPASGPESNLSSERLHAQLLSLRSKLGQRFHISQLIGESDAVVRIREQVRIAADSRARALVIGPPGSGRQHVARTIHFAQSSALAGPLIPIACPLLDAEQLQAELASLLRRQHESPTAPPPVALLLDVDRLREGAQQELAGFLALPDIQLHTLATGRVPLQRLAGKGKFRQDLAYTLSTLTIVLPPLAKRSTDIPLLAQHFLEHASAAQARHLSGFQPAAMELLAGLSWPGNIDELAKAVHEACHIAAGPQVTLADLPNWVHLAKSASAHPPRRLQPIRIDEFLGEIEKELFQRALAMARGNKSKAAQLLGISRPRLLRRLAQLGLIAPPATEEPVVFEPLPEEPLQQ
jgi:hypothetical protein